MQKKIYEVPALEVIETEVESMLAGSIDETLNPENKEEENEEPIGSNKKQYGFNSAPWE